MNHQRIVEHFRDKILSLDINGITADDIQIPNVPFLRSDRTLWFEITLGEGEPLPSPESTDRRTITVDLVCVAQAGSSMQRLNAVADRVSRLYSPVSSSRGGFRLLNDVFVCRKVQKLPVLRVSRYQQDHTTEGVKLNVQFVFDKYSKEI